MNALRALHLCLATLIPMVVGLSWGLLVALITCSRRKGLNQMTRLLGYLGPMMAATPINVRTNQSLKNIRPAIFIFNHQSGLDPVILCNLIKRDVVGISKSSLKHHPVIGPLLWFGETIFIDRLDKAQRRTAYTPALNALNNGRSIAIAPEGTRINHLPVGDFKLGAFRIAKETGVPIIPIVIYNAKSRLAARSCYLNPGPIDVDILPAVNPKDFKDSLEETAAHIRQDYLEKISAYYTS